MGEVGVDKLPVTERSGVDDVGCTQDGIEPVRPRLNMARRWPDNLMKRHIRPAARKAGIHKNIGWHTFGTLLKDNGEDVKTVQELLRHANSRITLDVYTQAVKATKRAAQSKVVRMMVPDLGTKEIEGNIESA
jgi:integrase